MRAVTLIVVAVQIVSALGLSCERIFQERGVRLRAFDAQLKGRSDSLLGAIQDAEDPADNVKVDPVELNVPPSDVYAVYGEHGKLIGRSANGEPQLIRPGVHGFRNERAQGKTYRVLQRTGLRIVDRDETAGVGLRRPVVILYASPMGHVWRETLEAASRSLLVIALASLVTSAVVFFFVRRALLPVSDLAMAASRISPTEIRFVTPPSASGIRELRPLAEALSRSVANLHRSFEREQRFLGDAAHELKTSVAVVQSSIQLLLLKPRSADEYVAGLEGVLSDSQRIELLVSQMLQLTALEREKPKSSIPMSNLTAAVEEACSILEPYASLRGVILDVQAHTSAPIRLSIEDARTLTTNLVVNAIQHSVAGSTVHVQVRRESGIVSLQVTDTGSGIRAEALPHIFERFYRADKSRTRETGGTGLGLSICKAIVDVAEGGIEVSSVENEGTCFVVNFTQA